MNLCTLHASLADGTLHHYNITMIIEKSYIKNDSLLSNVIISGTSLLIVYYPFIIRYVY